jgi:uncharacterized LabA/DUF88 family protein
MNRNIGVFVDIISIHRNIKRLYKSKLDYRAYMDKVSKRGKIIRAFAYGAQVTDEAKKFISFLRAIGFEVKYSEAKKHKVYPNEVLNTIVRVFNLKSDDNVLTYLEQKVEDFDKPDVVSSVQQTDRSIDMIVDILNMIDRMDTVIIGSSNPRLAIFVNFLKSRGLQVIVFSCSIPQPLKDTADAWWEVNESLLEETEGNPKNAYTEATQ